LRHVTSILFFWLATYSALYGVTRAYQLHHIVNVVVAWLVAVHSFGSGLSLKQLDQTLQVAGLKHASSDGKKLP
ncbi:GPI inositol deacylase, partial [Ascosphaera acerosa]